MKRQSTLFYGLVAAAILITFAPAVFADGIAIGSKMENFSLPDTAGKLSTLSDLKGRNGAVIVFLSAQCPVVRGYNERISRIAADYETKGIRFIGINSNATESLDWVKSNAVENYKFPVLIDKGNVLADKLGASVTPEIFLIDANNVLVYHGAVDNDRSGGNITKPYLRSAIDAVIGGKKVEITEINAFGCSIKRVGDK